MKFVVVTYGTEGDTRPLSALCRGLLDAGHDARLLADRATLGTAEALGVPTTPLAGDIKDTLQSNGSLSHVVRKGRGFGGTAQALARIANANAEAWLRDTVAAGDGCDAIIASGLAAFAGLSAAEALRVKAIGAGLIPITPTRAFASPFLSPTLVPRMLHRASHVFVNAMLWRAFRHATNAARAKVCGLPPRQSVWDSHPMLYGISPAIVPRPDDWPAHAQLCGQWVRPSAEPSPPEALVRFLAAGEPPLYIGFGSMAGFDAKALLDASIVAAAGRRVLFSPGWSGVDTAQFPPNFFAVGDVPHDWLLPKTSVVVHHGGSGTTHSAARAGVPSVVVPFAGDQRFWAHRLEQLGIAPKAMSANDPDARDLAGRIAAAETAAMRSRAQAIGERMRAENGVANALAAIAAIMAR